MNNYILNLYQFVCAYVITLLSNNVSSYSVNDKISSK